METYPAGQLSHKGMEADENAGVRLVVEHMQKAHSYTGSSGKEEARLMHLRGAKDLILGKYPDLIDNFWTEMLATRHERNLGIIAFCLEWIQEACHKDPMLIKEKSVFSKDMLLQLMDHQSVVIQKRSLMAATQIYRNTLTWVCTSGVPEIRAESVWLELKKVKDHVTLVIGEDHRESHVGFRLLSYKFMESVIQCQSPRDPAPDAHAARDDLVSSLDVPEKFTGRILSRKVVELEANEMFKILEGYLTRPQFVIDYVDCISICGCLFNLAKRRSQFLARIVTAVEFVLSNIPESYSKLQVEGLRKFLKVGLMSIVRRSDDGTMLERVVQLLTRHFGTSQNEIHRNRPNISEMVRQKRREPESDGSVASSKRMKTDADDEEPEPEPPRARPDLAVDPNVLATDMNTDAVVPRLTPNKVVQLVINSMRRLPVSMPNQFHAAYTPIGSGPMEDIIQHLARLMAVQMVAAQVGPGPEEVARRRQEEAALQKQLAASADQDDETSSHPISTIGQRQIRSTLVGGKDEEPDSGDEAEPGQLAITEAQMQAVPDAFRATEKAFRLNEVTEPIPVDDRGNAILSIVNELMASDGNVANACGEYIYHKCLIRFAVKVGLEPLRERIMKFILEDLAGRSELAFRWIYEEYAVARQLKRNPDDNIQDELKNYDICLTAFIRAFIDHPEFREGLVSQLYLDVPIVTKGAIDLLNYYCAGKSLHGAMRLIQKLVSSRPNAERFVVPALEMTLHQRKDIHTQAVQTCVKLYTNMPELREQIKTYAVDCVKLLCDPMRPPDWFFSETYGRSETTRDFSWNEELQKMCTTLFTGILSEDASLLPVLGEIYVEHPNDVKKTIFKVIEQPMKTIGMNAPEMLNFVRGPPKGSESLVLRMIHLLTETHPPTTELITSIRQLYNERIPDVRFLIPILNGLPKEEIFAALPKLIKLNPVVVQEVFHRLLGTGKHKLDSTQRRPSVTPAEVLIELHKIDMTKADVKTLMKATGICLEEKELYPADTMIEILRALVEVQPLPFLLMRTVLQTINAHARLTPMIMKLLHRLIEKQIWTNTLLWEGFVKCCEKTLPSSLDVLLELPANRLAHILSTNATIKTPLQQYVLEFDARQRSAVPEPVLRLFHVEPPPEQRPVEIVPAVVPEEPVPSPKESRQRTSTSDRDADRGKDRERRRDRDDKLKDRDDKPREKERRRVRDEEHRDRDKERRDKERHKSRSRKRAHSRSSKDDTEEFSGDESRPRRRERPTSPAREREREESDSTSRDRPPSGTEEPEPSPVTADSPAAPASDEAADQPQSEEEQSLSGEAKSEDSPSEEAALAAVEPDEEKEPSPDQEMEQREEEIEPVSAASPDVDENAFADDGGSPEM